MIKGTYLSADSKTDVAYYVFEPKDKENIKGVVQVSHGMQDYILRYKHLIEFLNEQGYVVCGNDALGHGYTTKEQCDKGFFAEKNGYKLVLSDLYTMTKIAKKMYKDVPHVLLGHSMGSFFARYYAYMFPNELDGRILCGTSGKVAGTGFAIKLLGVIKIFKGAKSPCKLAEKIMTGKYFKYVDNVETGKEWVTSDPERLKAYENDNIRGYQFKVGGYIDMLKVLRFVNSKKWARGINKKLPIALYSGSHDPVGDYGKGVNWVYGLLETQKVEDIYLKLYPKARHELHNEQTKIRNEFLTDVAMWLEDKLEK